MSNNSTFPLSAEQRRIVEYNDGEGCLLVTANAGSGKTRVLTERARFLLEKNEPFSILCLTFTNKAAEEMANRLKNVPFAENRAFINTFHQFGLDILRNRRHLLGYDTVPHLIDKESDKIQLLENIFQENELLFDIFDQQQDKQAFLKEHLNWISKQKQNLIVLDTDTHTFENWKNDHILLYKAYNANLKSQNMIDFDDLLLLAWRIFDENPRFTELIRRQYKYILIDEAQDLNFAQYQLLRKLCNDSHRNVLMVGDPQQSIHAYAGADPKYMQTDFVRDFGLNDTQIMKIEKNYRSSAAIVRFASQISGRNEAAAEQQNYKGEVSIEAFENTYDEAEFVIKKIKELTTTVHSELNIRFDCSQIAVLARNKFILNPLISLLEQDETLKNKFHFLKNTDTIQPVSTSMKVFDALTALLANPHGELYTKNIAQYLNLKDENNALTGFEKLRHYNNNLLNVLIDLTEKLSEMSNFRTVLSALENLCEQENNDENAVFYEDIQTWKTIYHKYLNAKESQNNTISNFRRFATMGVSHDTNIKGIELATSHLAKGLEYEIVFLIGMNDNVFPDYRAIKGGNNAMQQEKNAFYVAVTRAKRLLYISYPKQKVTYYGNANLNVSRFLLNL